MAGETGECIEKKGMEAYQYIVSIFECVVSTTVLKFPLSASDQFIYTQYSLRLHDTAIFKRCDRLRKLLKKAQK